MLQLTFRLTTDCPVSRLIALNRAILAKSYSLDELGAHLLLPSGGVLRVPHEWFTHLSVEEAPVDPV